jgi:transcriptional regulator with XRE-family HTH domain
MNHSNEMTFAEELRYLRHRKRITQQQLAEQLGLNRNTVAAWESGMYLPRSEKVIQQLAQFLQLGEQDIRSLESSIGESVSVLSPIISLRVIEEPLTAYNLTTIISSLTELSTKYWLIAKGRFADLIEYTQTHNGQFVEEAGVVVTKISYNSPMNMDWKVDLSAPSIAEAIVTTIDGITQAPKRLKQKELENQARAQEIQHVEQQASHEQQMALLQQERQRLEVEKQRLEVLEKQLEIQKKGIEYALEIAGKVVDLLHPSADSATRAMEIQALLPNLVQLQNGRGLELALPALENEKPTTKEK